MNIKFKKLSNSIVKCKKCSRLINFSKKICKNRRKQNIHEVYWGKPVTGFGNSNSKLMIVGLAPAAHGGTRTGRAFTGDKSGDFLFKCLFLAKISNQSTSTNITDGLKPDGTNPSIDSLPVTQVSYNDAIEFCKWADVNLPTYNQYWELVSSDDRLIVSDNIYPISSVESVNIIGNVWDITEPINSDQIRLAGGSLFCSIDTCHGTQEDRELFVDKETGNIHIGFSILTE